MLGNGELLGRACAYPLPGPVPPALAGCVLDGELVGNVFWCFDITEASGQDLRDLPLRERKGHLAALQKHFPAWIQLVPSARPGLSSGDYLRQVLAAGGEGVVSKDLAASYGNAWRKAKRCQTFDVVVSDTSGGNLSVAIGQYQDGELVPCGRVSIRNLGILDNLRPGAVLEIVAQGRTVKNKFREPRFVRVRTDKPACDCTIERIEP